MVGVTGIGNAIVDVIHPASDDYLLQHKIAKGVMTLIDEHRAHQLISGATSGKDGSGGKESSGGSAANTMAGLASFGAKGQVVKGL